MELAPFFAEVADGPEGGTAYWLRAEDGVRLRLGVWPGPKGGVKGTVLLFPGRTEYIEKYGRTAADLAERGYAMLAVDWRGQGLADRLSTDPAIGHVGQFSDYQRDVRAVIAAAEKLDLPRTWHLLGHSMGGAIGLRAAREGLAVASAVFSAPMWGIVFSPLIRPLAWGLSATARSIGLGKRYAPGSTGRACYVLVQPFEGNMLTRDRAMYDYMRRQLEGHPELALGGPSLAWLHEALLETRALRKGSPPALPALVGLGGAERIVDIAAVQDYAARWPGVELKIYDGAEHEILMEGPEVRGDFLDAAARLFGSAGAWGKKIAVAG